MNELTLDGKTYVSSKRAAEITGYAKDYVGQLCREGHVEARLVGRNWYVLESSIREHRFGAKGEVASAAKKEPVNMARTWDPPRYEVETPAYIPALTPIEEEKIIPAAREEPKKAHDPLVSDMQAAWQEWFSRKSEAAAVPESIEEAAETPEPEPIAEEKEEEAVPIAITPIEDEEVATQEEFEPVYAAREEVYTEDEEEAEIEEEIRSEANRGRTQGTFARNLILRSVFVGISLIAFAVSMIGTGFAEKIAGSKLYRLPEINLISGVSSYNK